MYQCAKCGQVGCKFGDLTKTLPSCPSKDEQLQEEVKQKYLEEENRKIAYNAALVEAEGYCQQCRVEETISFLKKCGYQKIGLVFCVGLQKEAREFVNIMEYHGFEMVSVLCKNGGIPKSVLGITDQQTCHGNCQIESMCNPVGQAETMNKAGVEFNILLGLCVGHDTLALKYLKAPTTVLAVKDRVTGHNPLAPIYQAQGYYKKKLYPPKND